ncbi:hypothetical protein WA026_013750 [Henosepilachna vigintioctopunctata]|uniref:C2H2-type domain-containing protein n=1 Tax=Henosepilachna vigintioctopunctata TaxID=420089 RepID=A0AAW1V0Z4_9CUCU
MFTNSTQLMDHKPLEPEKTCSFKCKVCSQVHSTPQSYMEHIMQHNSFTPKRPSLIPKTGLPMNLPNAFRYVCVSCNSRFEDCYELRRHEITVHNKKEEQVYQSEKQKSKIVVSRNLYPSLPQKSLENHEINETNQSERAKSTQHVINSEVIGKINETNQSGRACSPQHILNSEVTDKFNKVSVDNSIDQQESNLDVDPRGVKRVRSIFDGDVNQRKDKLLKIISKRSNRPKKAKPTSKSNGPTVTLTKKNVDKKPTVRVSNRKTPVNQPPEVSDCIKKEKLTCDICFDIFVDINSFQEHMEFHKDLDLKFSDNIENATPDASKNAIETAASSDNDVEIVENENITPITEDTADKKLDKPVNEYLQKKIIVLKSRQDLYLKNVEDQDDSEVGLTIDEGPAAPKETSNAANSRVRFPTECFDCKMSFKKHRSLRLHLSRRFHCKYCEFSNCKLSLARFHILNAHHLHFCWRCKNSFDTVELLREHYKMDHTCNRCQRMVTFMERHTCSVDS